MDNPLYNGGGKDSNPRNCHTPKFRKNYDGINWKSDWKNGPYVVNFMDSGTKKEISKKWMNKVVNKTFKEIFKKKKK